MMEINRTKWLEDFCETSQGIQEEALLLEALSEYALAGECRGMCFLQALRRLSDYLSQRAAELEGLEERLGLKAV